MSKKSKIVIVFIVVIISIVLIYFINGNISNKSDNVNHSKQLTPNGVGIAEPSGV